MKDYCYFLIPDAMAWDVPALRDKKMPTEFYKDLADVKLRYQQLREQPYNYEYASDYVTGCPYARLTIGIVRNNARGPLKLVEVRGGVNYLSDDFYGPFSDVHDKMLYAMARDLIEAVGVDRIRIFNDSLAMPLRSRDMYITEWRVPNDICSDLKFSRFLNRDKQQLFLIRDDVIYYRENSKMSAVKGGETALARIRALVPLRDTCRELIDAQLENFPDEYIQKLQARLNDQYDAYRKKYGLINSRGTASAFREDSGYFLLCSLENLDDEGNFKGKTDMFTKRTIRPAQAVDHVDTAEESLALSLSEQGHVDLGYMSKLTGKTTEAIINDLTGIIFRDPVKVDTDGNPIYLPADEYLSGNVREKLQAAKAVAANDPQFQINVAALEKVQPKDLEASEISVRLGATWIPAEYVQQFLEELLDAPYYTRRMVKVEFAAYTGSWTITNKKFGDGNIKATVTYGTNRANAYLIAENALNLRSTQIRDKVTAADGSVSWVLNKEATQAAQEKQRQICEQFQDWIFKEPERRQRLVAMLYTQLFQQLYYQADSVHGGRLPVHVHFVMDEFANVALPDEFDKLLSTMRSREISVSIIIQNLAQLKALFEKQWESIVGNCDEFLYLGGNEQSTHEYVSKLLGKETIDTNTYGRSRGRNGSYSTNYQLAGRELMTPDEVRMLDNRYALLFIRGERPIQDLKYDILHHPNVALTTDGSAPAYTHGEDTRSIASMAFSFDKKAVKNAEKLEAEKHEFLLYSEEELEELLDEKEKKDNEET